MNYKSYIMYKICFLWRCTMGKLIIDGNSFFEIDDECVKRKKNLKECGLEKYMKDNKKEEKEKATE